MNDTNDVVDFWKASSFSVANINMKTRKFFTLTSIISGRLGAPRKGWMMMVDKTEKATLYPLMIHEQEPDVYTVSLLRNNNQDINSYVEHRIAEGHPLYAHIRYTVGVLNVAGPLQEVKGVGASYQSGVYSTIIGEDMYKELMGDS